MVSEKYVTLQTAVVKRLQRALGLGLNSRHPGELLRTIRLVGVWRPNGPYYKDPLLRRDHVCGNARSTWPSHRSA